MFEHWFNCSDSDGVLWTGFQLIVPEMLERCFTCPDRDRTLRTEFFSLLSLKNAQRFILNVSKLLKY